MKLLLLSIIIFASIGCTKEMNTKTTNLKEITPSTQNSFQDVWSQVASDPLNVLPQDKVSFGKLSSWGKNIILEDANRTLQEHADILPYFDKLAHPNGICLKGYWEIYEENPYSGYFKNRSKALIIARASSALSNTKSGQIRSFGFAGKLFPSTNKKKVHNENTANFFLIDDLGGTDAKHYTDVSLTNAPETSFNSEVIKNLLYALELANSFTKVDKSPAIRQLYEVSELGEKERTHIITPKWMKVEAKTGQTVDAKDFRDELHIAKNAKFVFLISVASKEDSRGKKEWKTIGSITFDTSVVSKSCDHRLHFHHPKYRDDLKYLSPSK
ncbi:MAG: hypothetical protein U9O24_06120 [Campylobacterota bacterium]|nr:hypothetical protein [Campylobacterota bacterium]